MRLPLILPACWLIVLLAAVPATPQFTLKGTGVNAADFTVTTFATGLNWPLGMAFLADSSIVVGISKGTSFFGSTTGAIVRLSDTNNDGVSDTFDTLAVLSSGKTSALRRGGNLLFVTGQGSGNPITIWRVGTNATDALTLQGTLTLTYPSGSWYHPHSGLAVRPTPNVSSAYDLIFSVGSDSNATNSVRTLALTSDIGVSGTLEDESVYMVRITDGGSSVSASNLVQLADGLRNATGFDFHPTSGDMYFQDNGIDGLVNANEPHSADELNILPAADIGVTLYDYGFPDSYTAYRTGTIVGGVGTQPLIAFQPLQPDTTVQLEGPQDVVFAPRGFPDYLNNGLFVGMHGKFSAGGVANEENPLVFVNLTDTTYFAFVDQLETGVGHLDGLLAGTDFLLVADISPDGGFGAGDTDEGKIYKIKRTAAGLSAPRFLYVNSPVNPGVSPVLDWGDVPGAASYTLVVADNSAFSGATTITGLTSSTYTFPTGLADATFYWKVKAINGATESADSITASFTVIPTMTEWVLLATALAMLILAVTRGTTARA